MEELFSLRNLTTLIIVGVVLSPGIREFGRKEGKEISWIRAIALGIGGGAAGIGILYAIGLPIVWLYGR